jgi:hypothetical protein
MFDNYPMKAPTAVLRPPTITTLLPLMAVEKHLLDELNNKLVAEFIFR